jgi:predicted phage tail protein
MTMQEHMLDVGSGELRAVRLYGVLGAKFGRVHYLAVSSLAEAMRALTMQLDGFKKFMVEARENGMDFAVFYGKHNLSESELQMEAPDADIRIAPIVRGAKKAGMFQIIVGAVLVVVGLAINVLSGGSLSWLGTPIIKFGVGMMLGGVVQMLTPIPKGTNSERPESTPSELFTGPVNTTAAGFPFPCLYGRLHIGSAVGSAGIETQDQAIIPAGGSGSYGGGSSRFHNEYYELIS